jgi:deoxyribonuclease V
MIACVDVDYRDPGAVAACVLLRDWADAEPCGEHVEKIAAVEPYEPGEFFRRELPCLRAVLGRTAAPVDVVVIDGYVWLDAAATRPGLGAHLFEALGRRTPVVGVAKTQFAGAAGVAVFRGGSRRPLIVTAAGMEPGAAARHFEAMHGAHRIPTLLKRVDQLCRTS